MRSAARTSRRQSELHTAHWMEPQTGTLTYIALGDSAAVGVGVEDPSDSYVGLIAKKLAESTEESVQVINLARSGAKAQDLLEHQLPRLAELPSPDFLTCVIGGNDVAWTTPFRVQTFASTMYSIASQLPDNTTIGLVPHFMHWPYSRRAVKANHAIRAAAEAFGHVVADIHSPTKQLGMRRYLRTFAKDLFHPNEEGYKIWAEAIWQARND